MSGTVRLLWWRDMPAGAVYSGGVAAVHGVRRSTAALWQRVQVMPKTSQEAILCCRSPLTARPGSPDRRSRRSTPSQVMPGKSSSSLRRPCRSLQSHRGVARPAGGVAARAGVGDLAACPGCRGRCQFGSSCVDGARVGSEPVSVDPVEVALELVAAGRAEIDLAGHPVEVLAGVGAGVWIVRSQIAAGERSRLSSVVWASGRIGAGERRTAPGLAEQSPCATCSCGP